jgi:hypothetical protein
MPATKNPEKCSQFVAREKKTSPEAIENQPIRG